MAITAGQQLARNSLPVVIASDQTAVLVGSSDIVVTVTPTIGAASDFAFDASDLIFDSAEIANAARANGTGTTLDSVVILDKADTKAVFTLVFANAATDFGTVDSAPDPDDAECATVVGWLAVAATDYFDLGGASVACIKNIGLLMQTAAASSSLWVAGINGAGTPNFGSASGLVLQLGFKRS